MKWIIGLIFLIVLFEVLAKATTVETPDVLTLQECYKETEDVMKTAADYIVKEAIANRKIESLIEILNDKDIEITILKKQIHHSIVK